MTPEFPLRPWRDRAKVYAQNLGHEVGDFITDRFQDQAARRLLCGCLRCGARVIVFFDLSALLKGDAEAVLIEGAATFYACQTDSLRVVETKAWLLGESPTLLESYLRREIEALSFEEQERFDPGEFQPQRKRWLSDDGLLALQWQLREFPHWPISADNKQAVWGRVQLFAPVNEDDLMPAVYNGPRLNLNDSENEDEWWCDPLETSETGFAYRDDEDRWRFKREEGTIGFIVSRSHLVFQRPWLELDATDTDDEMEPDNPHFYP